MPVRIPPLISGEFYHIFNRGIASQATFLNKRDYQRMMRVIIFYRNDNLPVKYSRFLNLPKKERDALWEKISQKKDFLIEIISYCLMPNHFHFLLKKTKKDGIKRFVGNLVNSYTKYFNIKRERLGPLFQGRFKAIRAETDEQLLHLSRYIHLNPYSSHLLRNVDSLFSYPYSSLSEYTGETREGICTKDIILDNFRTKEQYRKFILDNADYQRRLQEIRHLLLDG